MKFFAQLMSLVRRPGRAVVHDDNLRAGKDEPATGLVHPGCWNSLLL